MTIENNMCEVNIDAVEFISLRGGSDNLVLTNLEILSNQVLADYWGILLYAENNIIIDGALIADNECSSSLINCSFDDINIIGNTIVNNIIGSAIVNDINGDPC